MSKWFAVSLCIFLFFSCKQKQEKPKESVDDFALILQKDTLTAITLNSSTSYFIYKEEPMGYDYDLIKDFCQHHNLNLKIVVAENYNRLLDMLEKGEGDLIAHPIGVMSELKDSIIYCGLEQISHQVLVQRSQPKDSILTDQTQLIGKEVYALRNTKYYQRLVNLNAELGGGIIIKDIEKDTVTTEDLIEMVSQDEIDYTVSDENLARLNSTYYRNIDISLPVSFEQRASWAVRKNSPYLAKALNEWFEQNGNTPVYKSIIKKYFELSKQSFDGDYVPEKNLPKGAISPYDTLFKRHAKGTEFKWQFLAAISYHESRFKNNITSWAGAAGIMGLMPRTAKIYGITDGDRMNPDLSIGVAVDLLDSLNRIFKNIKDKDERLKFILAAYNGGSGHISDAQALAQKYGDNPHVWEGSVKKYLELKSNPEFYNDPVCKNGYFRGNETIRYVNNVLSTTRRFEKICKK